MYVLDSNDKCVKSVEQECAKGFKMNKKGVCKYVNKCRQFKSRYGKCKNTPGGAKVKCRKGFKFQKEPMDCVDINECKSGTSNCADLCDNTKGGYVCKCLTRGFKLGEDKHSCEAIPEVTVRSQVSVAFCNFIFAQNFPVLRTKIGRILKSFLASS